MYKNKLQELCQKKAWSLPSYDTTRDGPPHNPVFTTKVTVNSIPFTSSTPLRTLKLSQNDAAMIAFNHFSEQNPIASPFLPNLASFPQPSFPAPLNAAVSQVGHAGSGSPVCSPDVGNTLPTNSVLQPSSEPPACQTAQINSTVATVTDVPNEEDLKFMVHLYKNQLHTYAQKRGLRLPEYAPEWEGPPHAKRFRCKVTIDGQTFQSPKFYPTVKEAEHAAAEIAFKSLSPNGVQEDELVVYKNLLQELVQKEGFRLPVYSTNRSGEAHKPTFISQVEVEGAVFTGQESKSKKQAEMAAAKVAYTTLKKRKAHDGQAPESLPNCSKENVITGLQHHSNGETSVSPGLVVQSPPNIDNEEKKSHSSGNMNGFSVVSSSTECKPIPSYFDRDNVDVGTSNMATAEDDSPPLRPKKVIVYAKKTNVDIENGGALMQISDDKWAAYSYSRQDD
ncbi:double-stranded RNA-binding protein 1-like isoform X1 [Vicia villosa]|uniref:double-stranded RNA-binding protein 1-like isoform X1 n=1 Tax=Vicia villosa TaxID=3911 RepID=UPI00273BD2A2|nr:double-stranded RNA-binding protein 1-like isoform X1 [Vicia villosa]